jgi:hypothetical protein
MQFAWRELSAPSVQNDQPRRERTPVIAGFPDTEGRSASTCPKGSDSTNCSYLQPMGIEEIQKTDSVEDAKPCWKSEDESSCGYIQPVDSEELQKLEKPNVQKVIEKLFPTYEDKSRITLAAGLAVGALVALGALFVSRYVRQYVFVETILLILGLGTGSLLCFYWEPIAQIVTENGDGAAISVFEGVSVWPTILLRAIGVVLSLYFIYRVLNGLDKNLRVIAEKMELRPEPETMRHQLLGIQEILNFRSWLRSYSTLLANTIGPLRMGSSMCRTFGRHMSFGSGSGGAASVHIFSPVACTCSANMCLCLC